MPGRIYEQDGAKPVRLERRCFLAHANGGAKMAPVNSATGFSRGARAQGRLTLWKSYPCCAKSRIWVMVCRSLPSSSFNQFSRLRWRVR